MKIISDSYSVMSEKMKIFVQIVETFHINFTELTATHDFYHLVIVNAVKKYIIHYEYVLTLHNHTLGKLKLHT